MTYSVKIKQADYDQLAIGLFGSNALPKAFVDAAKNKDDDFFIKYAANFGDLNKNGVFKRKRDAIAAANNIEKYNMYGLGYNMCKNGVSGKSIVVCVEKN